MPIKAVQLSGGDPFLYIASYNGSKTKTGLATIKNNLLNSAVLGQIGMQAYAEFQDDFINYKSGLILCVNTPFDLNKFFQTTPASGSSGVGAFVSVPNSVVFTVVRMPTQFINKKGNLTKDYEYGEKLAVRNSVETSSIGSQIYELTAGVSNLNVNPKRLPSYIIRRDANMIGRSVKTQTSGGGGGVGVWS